MFLRKPSVDYFFTKRHFWHWICQLLIINIFLFSGPIAWKIFIIGNSEINNKAIQLIICWLLIWTFCFILSVQIFYLCRERHRELIDNNGEEYLDFLKKVVGGQHGYTLRGAYTNDWTYFEKELKKRRR